ncbi:ribosomal protein S5 domain 2-type protein [Coniella lustricola]|uniref:Ribosomal protein S5 domain 2-type protein n=1 Tax=Coniella lustricola TaxID=2025994 RepID=A0A2T3ACX8_9PEZI|nr:ribosomal protein S5 domain 2-type protein [Coniella lustricola]
MTAPQPPLAALSPLPKADGSATYSYAGYTVTASVNGPIEAQRRDENPYEALVDVVVRPASGVGGTRERHLESLLQQSLRQLILIKDFPRCLIQVVLQITASPANEYVNTKLVQAGTDLSILPALLQAAVLALLSGAVPLRSTATCVVAAVPAEPAHDSGKPTVLVDPSPRQVDLSRSVHVLAFTSHNELLLAESEGDFSMDEWDCVFETAHAVCCTQSTQGIDMVLDDDQQQGPDLHRFVRSIAEAKVAADLHWK